MITLKYRSDYLSIRKFEDVILEDFSILTGLNGSGKTHILTGLLTGSFILEGYDSSEIMYYNYTDFTVSTDKSSNNSIYQAKNNFWNHQMQANLNRLVNSIQSSNNNFRNTLDSLDQFLFNYFIQPNFDFHKYFSEPDFEILSKLVKDNYSRSDLQGNINKFSPAFSDFLKNFFRSPNLSLSYLTYDFISNKFKELTQRSNEYFKNNNPSLYSYISEGIGFDRLAKLNVNDFESPNFFLEDISNEEKSYQIKKTQNTLNKINNIENKLEIAYYENDEFIELYGDSPLDRINKVLNEYDCNGYKLTSGNNPIPLGVDLNNINVQIGLINSKGQYQTNFEHLSSGEKTLIALSLLIYKTKKEKIIPRVLLLDEIDSSLHPSMINRILNVIENLFVKQNGLKVIMATHSPTTVALGPPNGVFIIDKFSENLVRKQDKEMAVQLLSEGFITLNKADTNLSISYNISKSTKAVLFTEGITDKIIIETAWKKLYSNYEMPFYVQDCFDAIFLANLFSRGFDEKDGIFINYPDKKLIALFDFDNEGYNRWNGLKQEKWAQTENDPYKILSKKTKTHNGFALLLPIPDNEILRKQVMKSANESYLNNSILTIELLFFGIAELDQYFGQEKIVGGGDIIIFSGDKRKFANNIEQLNKECFKEFEKIFNKIKQIMQE